MEEKEFYNKVGKNIGWDFSKINSRTIVENKTWKITDIIKSYLNKDKIVLDLGIGGGEKTLLLSPLCKELIGIDNSEEMIIKANDNLKKTDNNNCKFIVAYIKSLPFNDEYFDVITCRHAPINVTEIHRVLKKGGIFISQQVGEEDKLNIKDIFGRGQNFSHKSGEQVKRVLEEFKKLDFEIIKFERYNAIEYYKDMQDIIFLLENTPITPNFNIKKDKEKLKELEVKYGTDKGIKTNSERYLIITKKR